MAESEDRCRAAHDEGEGAFRSALGELVEACKAIRKWLRLHPCPAQIVNTTYKDFARKLQTSAEIFLSSGQDPDDVAFVARIMLLRSEDEYLKKQIDWLIDVLAET